MAGVSGIWGFLALLYGWHIWRTGFTDKLAFPEWLVFLAYLAFWHYFRAGISGISDFLALLYRWHIWHTGFTDKLAFLERPAFPALWHSFYASVSGKYGLV